ncbi:MAG: thiamine-phosphate kinase [Candidatus Thorarchaeota archaeon]
MTHLKTLGKLGEVATIRLLQAFLDTTPHLGQNEDAYLYSNTPPHILVNVDTMSRASDFLPQQTWSQIGTKLVATTFSDLAAKGALPELFLASLALENSMYEEELKELVSSIQITAHKYQARYLGGDLGSSQETVLTGVGIGSIPSGKILTRRDAAIGDLVCVTGYFGLTTIGLDYLLSSEQRRVSEVPTDLMNRALNLLFEPMPQILAGRVLSEHRLATASIDCSDGLAISLHWLAQASNVGVLLRTLPIYPELEPYLETNLVAQDITLYGGEEYVLVFTISPAQLDELKRTFEQNDLKYLVIGECVSNSGVFLEVGGTSTPVPMRGWDAFQGGIR